MSQQTPFLTIDPVSVNINNIFLILHWAPPFLSSAVLVSVYQQLQNNSIVDNNHHKLIDYLRSHIESFYTFTVFSVFATIAIECFSWAFPELNYENFFLVVSS